jgi:hypothetical protein
MPSFTNIQRFVTPVKYLYFGAIGIGATCGSIKGGEITAKNRPKYIINEPFDEYTQLYNGMIEAGQLFSNMIKYSTTYGLCVAAFPISLSVLYFFRENIENKKN